MNRVLDKLVELNEIFKRNDKNGYLINGKSYILKRGKIPILLSAPHAVKQLREGVVKDEDYLTGPLTIYLADLIDCSYIVRVCNEGDDPNYPIGLTLDKVCTEYLETLVKCAKEWEQGLVIDMHGCKNIRSGDVNIWYEQEQLCDKGIVTLFTDNFMRHGLSVGENNEFLGGQVTRQASRVTNAFQLEIKRRLRSVKEENWDLVNAFLKSMEISLNETGENILKLRK